MFAATVQNVNLALLVLRLLFGFGLMVHGWRKIAGQGGLTGTAGWFDSIGMRQPALQARLAAGTELGAGLLFAAGLLTPLAAAALVALMVVAYVTTHRGAPFLVLNGGWELEAAYAGGAIAVGTIGPGEWSLDELVDRGMFTAFIDGWSGLVVTVGVGVAGAALQLAAFYRPQQRPDAK